MSAEKPEVQKCGGPGHKTCMTKDQASRFAREVFRKDHGGRGKVYRCSWGDHYHVTRGHMGQRGRRTR